MEVFIVDITSWTASFRYPNLISGVQPTLEVPPISTILGLINAACGRYMRHKNLRLGYYFEYEMKSEDLETIYQISSKDGKPTNNAKSNIIRREFLFNNFLRIYTDNAEIAKSFEQPYYPLLLGRMNDLATLKRKPTKTILERIDNPTNIRGQIIPFQFRLPGQLQALPQYFTDEFPRKNLGTEPFSIISHKSNVEGFGMIAYRDILPSGKPVDIFLHLINHDD